MDVSLQENVMREVSLEVDINKCGSNVEILVGDIMSVDAEKSVDVLNTEPMARYL